MVSICKARNSNGNVVSQSNFLKIWDDHFPHVTIPKVRTYMNINNLF